MKLPTLNFREENIATVPNLLTSIRFFVSGYVCYLLVTDGPSIQVGATYAAGAITDALDGKIARRWPSQATDFGKRLDPLSDAFAFHTPLWALAYTAPDGISQGLYLASSGLLMARDSYLFKRAMDMEKYNEVFPVSPLGKIKTAINMSALTVLISTANDYPEMQTIGKWLLGMGAATSLVSLVDYYERLKEKATKRLGGK